MLPSQFGLESDRRILLANNNTWRSPELDALYTPLGLRAQPLVSDSTQSFFDLYQGMVMQGNLNQQPGLDTAPSRMTVAGEGGRGLWLVSQLAKDLDVVAKRAGGKRVQAVLGPVLYNLYGSTEVAWATIATPEDLQAAPGTAGRPPRGTVVKLYDDKDNEVEQGETGRIFVGNEMQFEGYTGGGGKDALEDLLSSGDVGHFNTILGKTPDGKYIVSDPMYTGGPVEMTREQLAVFFGPSYGGTPSFLALG